MEVVENEEDDDDHDDGEPMTESGEVNVLCVLCC
jgi:hypothetical protein